MNPPLPPALSPVQLKGQLKTNAASLGPAERRVAQVLVEHFDEVPGLSANEVGNLADVSAATVVRATRSLGFSGYNRLKEEIRRAQIVTEGQHRQASDEESEDIADPPSDTAGVARSVFNAAASEIEMTQTLLDDEALTQAVDALAAAHHTLLLGTGGSAIPAQDAALRYTMSGLSAVAPGDVLGQLFAARQLGPSDLAIAVSYSGANKYTLEAVRAAAAAGATVLAITSSPVSVLAKLADITLIAGSVSEDQEILVSRISHTLVLNILGLSVQRLRHNTTMGPSSAITELVAGSLESLPEDAD